MHQDDEPDYLTAVALQYQENSLAPEVVAKGRGLLAQEIIRRAKDAGVYVHESRELVSLLMKVDLDQHIPANLYLAVAELLAWVYHVEHHHQAIKAGQLQAPDLAKTIAESNPPQPISQKSG